MTSFGIRLRCTAQVPERYFQMLLALHGLQNETFRNGWLTWVDWSRTDPSGWHPWNADADSTDEELLFLMRTARHGQLDLAGRVQGCLGLSTPRVSRAAAAVLRPGPAGLGTSATRAHQGRHQKRLSRCSMSVCCLAGSSRRGLSMLCLTCSATPSSRPGITRPRGWLRTTMTGDKAIHSRQTHASASAVQTR